jgi:ATP-dependent DNA helicase RecG
MEYKESEILELKRELTSEISKEIIALANTKGGQIIIGVNDDGNIMGVENSKQVCESLSSLIKDSIKPDITTMISINTKSQENREIVIIDIMRGLNRPYYLTGKGLKPMGVYVRLGNTSIPANENAIRQMIALTDGTSYENMRSFNQVLNFEYTKNFFQKQELAFEIQNMKTLSIINNDGLYTNLGLLLSDECQHIIKVAVFEDTTNTTFVDRKEFNGSILKQLTDAYDYMKLNNKNMGPI